MKGVFIFAGFLIVLAALATFGLVYAKVAQKMFTGKSKKEITK